ncbi:MAG: hypothetical protein V4463_12180 [Pseudomonadota bacterium]
MMKFEFSVQNRYGQRIDNILIAGKDQGEAEKRLRQMYMRCVVLRCQARHPDDKPWQATSVEDLMTMIAKSG